MKREDAAAAQDEALAALRNALRNDDAHGAMNYAAILETLCRLFA